MKNISIEDYYFTPQEAADYLNISARRLHDVANAGHIIKLKGSIYDRASVEAYKAIRGNKKGGRYTMLKVNGVWTLENLPQNYVVELPDGGMHMFYVAPFRAITEDELTPYKGYHPNKIGGIQMDDAIYRFYGLEK